MYEFLVLGRLAHGPMHGYLIAKIIGDMIGPFRQVHWGGLYPLLARLEREGLIQAEECAGEGDGRVRKVYAITDAGRERLHEHLMDTTRHQGEYDDMFFLKVAHFWELRREERLFLARHYAVYAQQHIDHLTRERRDLVENVRLSGEEEEYTLAVMDHRIDYWRRELAWAEALIARQRDREAV